MVKRRNAGTVPVGSISTVGPPPENMRAPAPREPIFPNQRVCGWCSPADKPQHGRCMEAVEWHVDRGGEWVRETHPCACPCNSEMLF